MSDWLAPGVANFPYFNGGNSIGAGGVAGINGIGGTGVGAHGGGDGATTHPTPSVIQSAIASDAAHGAPTGNNHHFGGTLQSTMAGGIGGVGGGVNQSAHGHDGHGPNDLSAATMASNQYMQNYYMMLHHNQQQHNY